MILARSKASNPPLANFEMVVREGGTRERKGGTIANQLIHWRLDYTTGFHFNQVERRQPKCTGILREIYVDPPEGEGGTKHHESDTLLHTAARH